MLLSIHQTKNLIANNMHLFGVYCAKLQPQLLTPIFSGSEAEISGGEGGVSVLEGGGGIWSQYSWDHNLVWGPNHHVV